MDVRSSSFTILVLDHNYILDGALADFLKLEGYRVLLASTAEEALAKTRQYQPDLILLDCEIKGIKCLSLLPELLVENPSAEVILLASRPSASSVLEAIKLGAVDYFERPLDLKGLKLVIDHHQGLLPWCDLSSQRPTAVEKRSVKLGGPS